MPASRVASPTALTCTCTEEPATTVPATTVAPTLRSTSCDSPVTIDSSSSAASESSSPSAGMRPPGRTSTTSPSVSSDTATVSVPSPLIRSASSGKSSASADSAPRAWPRARISIQCPSSMMTTRAASSHQKSRPKRPSDVAQLARNATVIAMAIRSIIPGWRLRTSPAAPARNGHPPYR